MRQESRKVAEGAGTPESRRKKREALRRRRERIQGITAALSVCIITAGMFGSLMIREKGGEAQAFYMGSGKEDSGSPTEWNSRESAQEESAEHTEETKRVYCTESPIWPDYDMVLASLAFQLESEEAVPAFGGTVTAEKNGEKSGEESQEQSEPGTVLSWEGREIIYYRQTDERFAEKLFGEDPIGRYGCGPTAMATVVSTLTETTIDPVEMAEWAYENGYWAAGSGAYHTLIAGAAKAFSLDCTSCDREDEETMKEALREGKLIVVLMGKGQFTDSGHFIVLYGVTDEGKIRLADPNSLARTEQEWELDVIIQEAKSYAADGGPFWIICNHED